MSKQSILAVATAAVLFLSVLCGCRETQSPPGSQEAAAVVVETDLKLPSFPHLFDVYRATNADTAIVFLHGGAGKKHHLAYQLGLIASDVEGDYSGVNEQAILDGKVVAVIPQGQAIPEAPNAYTWSNHVMTSGQDDLQFIRGLLGYISQHYHATKFYIVGHSNGGMMANRIWCEAPDLFDAYIAIAGPPSARYADGSCTPATVKPYLGIVGSDDDVLQVPGNWAAPVWSINPALWQHNPAPMLSSVVLGERYFLPSRAMQRCSETVADDDAGAAGGALTTWSFCGGSIMLIRIESGTHTLTNLQGVSGRPLIDYVSEFTGRLAS